MAKSSCDMCAYYVYDEDYDEYYCDMDLDEDEMYRFINNAFDACPYFTDGDEYKTARKQ